MADNKFQSNILVKGKVKLPNESASKAMTIDSSGQLTSSATTDTELAYVSGVTSSIQTQLTAKIPLTQKGAANGVATLDAGGKVPVTQLPNSVMEYQGAWNASTNTPTLVDGTGNAGDVYRTSVAGSQTFNSILYSFGIGDFIIYSGTVWEKAPASDAVLSVFGRQGTVIAVAGDYTASQVTNVPAGNIAAITVQAALNELDTEKVPTTTTITAGSGLTGGGDLSANRTISMPNVGTAGTKGSASAVPVFVTDAQGRVSSSTDTAIAITSTQVTDFNEAAQDAVGTILTDSTTIDFTYNDAGNTITAAAITQLSITSDASGIKLVNDASTPGNTKYYGTDGSGTKGFFAIPAVGSAGDIQETSFSAANNQAAAAAVTGLAFAAGTVRSFKALVSVAIDATADLFESFELLGINKGSTFDMSVSSVGDDSGIVFSITSAGQVQYTSTNVSGFVTDTMKFRAYTTTV